MDLNSLLHRRAQPSEQLQFVRLQVRRQAVFIQLLVESAFRPTELSADYNAALDLRNMARLYPVVAGTTFHAGWLLVAPKTALIKPTVVIIGEAPACIDESVQVLYRDKHIRIVYSPKNNTLVALPCLPAPIKRLV